jgi:hypothetical protein
MMEKAESVFRSALSATWSECESFARDLTQDALKDVVKLGASARVLKAVLKSMLGRLKASAGLAPPLGRLPGIGPALDSGAVEPRMEPARRVSKPHADSDLLLEERTSNRQVISEASAITARSVPRHGALCDREPLGHLPPRRPPGTIPLT